MKNIFEKIFGSYSEREIKRIDSIVDQIENLENEISKLEDQELKGKTEEFKERLKNGESLDDILPEAYAVVREASTRVLGMKHFRVQLVGGIILHQGRISEMKTGEGKTLAATLPVYLNAFEETGVHIVTVNDYLAKRDRDWMGKIYNFLGLSVGCLIHGISKEERKQSYLSDITYGTNNEFGFDYLRDNMIIKKEDMVQRDLNYCIIDEVDSILIDEARTPLIISGQGDENTKLYFQANSFAKTLEGRKKDPDEKIGKMDMIMGEGYEEETVDFIIDEKGKNVTLTEKGVTKAENYFNIENLAEQDNMELTHHINSALKSQHIMKRDSDYIVKNGEVIIVDQFTGRLMQGRRYSNGLHQAIEAKEEFREIYVTDVVEIPTNQPVIRDDYSDVIYKNEIGKYNAVIEEIIERNKKGQPVLVGTVSIERSELLSKLLGKKGIKHEVLDAKNHEKEAEIVAQAGRYKSVTIATNMAGRGTDIVLGGNPEHIAKTKLKDKVSEEIAAQDDGFDDTDDPDVTNARKIYRKLLEQAKEDLKDENKKVIEAGGLAIIGTERHESRRIDNQLRGRAGRQGDPGTSRFYISLEDDLMRLFAGDKVKTIVDTLGLPENEPLEHNMLTKSIETAQGRVEGRNFNIRKHVLQYDNVMNRQREVIYSERRKVLMGEDLRDYIFTMIEEIVDENMSLFTIDKYPENWDIEGYQRFLSSLVNSQIKFEIDNIEGLTKEKLKEMTLKLIDKIYERKEEELQPERFRELERID